MWLFWRKQRENIVRLLVAIAVVVVGWQGWNFYQEHEAASLQADYQAASGAPALLAFAQAHPQAMLGKIAQLEAADALYKDAQFKQAADAYAQAATQWGADEKGQRARLGEAVALLQSGDTKTGSELLETLANDASAVESYRAESAYYLAILAAQAGDNDGATKWIAQVKEFKEANAWISQASTLSEIVPLLKGVTTKTGYTPPPAAVTSLTPATVTPAETPAPAAMIAPKPAAVPSAAPSGPPAAPSSKPAPANGSNLLNVPLPAINP
jgi:hypothetical protein